LVAAIAVAVVFHLPLLQQQTLIFSDTVNMENFGMAKVLVDRYPIFTGNGEF